MESASTDSSAAASSPNKAPAASRSRWWLPAGVLLVLGLALATLSSLPDDSLDPGMANLYAMVGTVVALLLLIVWFLFFSGFSARVRASGLAVLALLAAGCVGAVRRVEFTGGMRPEFDWRWTTSREAVLDQYLAQSSVPDAAQPPKIQLVVATAEDMAEYRGARRDGVVQGPLLARDWQAAPPRELWKHPVGGGYASLAVVGNLAITIEQRRGDEAVVAYDLASGAELWEHRYPALFSESLGGDGPRATPTLVGDKVYSLGATGVLVCLRADSGEQVWSTNILETNGVPNLTWGMSGSPLVVDGLVIVNPGSQKGGSESRALLALDAETGERRWAAGKTPAAYASPMLATLAGQQQIVIFDAEGLGGYLPADGQELWRAEWKTPYANAAAQPLVLPEDQLYFSTDQGGGVVQVRAAEGGFQAEILWTNNQMKCAYANPVFHEGYIFGLDEGILVCQNAADGKRAWKRGRYGHGQLLLSGDLLVVLSEQGDLALVEASPGEYRELGKIQALEGKTWNNPVLVRGRALVRNHLQMACYELPLAEASDATDAPASLP